METVGKEDDKDVVSYTPQKNSFQPTAECNKYVKEILKEKNGGSAGDNDLNLPKRFLFRCILSFSLETSFFFYFIFVARVI